MTLQADNEQDTKVIALAWLKTEEGAAYINGKLNQAYQDGKDNAEESSGLERWDEGYRQGYDEGYENGYSYGWDEGYAEAEEELSEPETPR